MSQEYVDISSHIAWDNCGVLHRVEPCPADSGRVTLEGEEAIA